MSSRNEVHINSALQLLQARKEALDRMNRSPMRPHGKVMKKDMFTWFDYQIDDLVSTFLSFPFPVHWIASKEEIETTFRYSKKLAKKVETIIIHDSSRFELDSEYADQIRNCISTDSIESALTMMKAIEQTEGVLMITGKSHFGENKDKIEAFIQTFKK